MKKIVLLLSLGILFSCQKNEETQNANQSSRGQLKLTNWHCRSQPERNQAIISRAYQDNSLYVGLNCKEWARRVVLDASESIMTLPSTNPSPNDWYWIGSQYVLGRSGLIQYAQPGEIVQMKLSGGGPHTAIIYSLTSTTVTFIESNWCIPECNIVNLRTITYSDFYAQVSNYTINQIL